MKATLLLSGALLFALSACSSDELPADYKRRRVPEARLSSEEARQRGRELYLQYCAICHGEKADGHGLRQNLSSRPQSFIEPGWRERSSPRRVFYVIREGQRGTAMVGWEFLGNESIWDLVAYLRSVGE